VEKIILREYIRRRKFFRCLERKICAAYSILPASFFSKSRITNMNPYESQGMY
jgi:hypothetical protein